MTLLALYLSLCGFSDMSWQRAGNEMAVERSFTETTREITCGFTAAPPCNAPPELRDSVLEIRRQAPTDIPTIYVWPAEVRIEA